MSVFLSFAIITCGGLLYAAADKTDADKANADKAGDEQGGFISQAVSNAVGKVNEYTSGDKSLISDDAQGADISGGRNEFGRRMPAFPQKVPKSGSDEDGF